MKRSAFYEYLYPMAGMTKKHPELVRLAKVTGYSAEHLFKIAIGARPASKPCAIAVSRNIKDRSVTPASFQIAGAK